MLTTNNRKIINTLNKQSRKQEKEQNDKIEASYSNEEIINKTHLDDYSHHVMLRLYSGFHINIPKNHKDDIQKVSMLAHLGLVNLHLTNKHMKVTLSLLGKAVMNKSRYKSSIIKKLLSIKDILEDIGGLLILLFLFGGLLIVICKPNNNLLDIIGGISIISSFGCVLLGLIVIRVFKDIFKYHYKITTNGILNTCREYNGQSQKMCEIKYIIKYYRRMLKSNKFSSGITISYW